MVADDAVVGDVGVGQQGVVVAEGGPFAFLRAEMDAGILAEDVAGADL